MEKQLFAAKRQEQLYSPDEIAYFGRSFPAKKFLDRKTIAKPGDSRALQEPCGDVLAIYL